MKKYIFLIIFIAIFPLVSSLEINNVTIIASGTNDTIFANYSNIDYLEITNDTITINKAYGESLFTSFTNFTIQIRSLVEPYNNIFFSPANTIIKTVNENINLINGGRLLIYSSGTNISQVISGSSGGGTTIIYKSILLDNITIENPIWIKEKENDLYVYIYDKQKNLIDPENISLDLDISSAYYTIDLVRTGKGIYKGTFKIDKEIEEIKIKATVKENGKIIEASKIIELQEETTKNKINSETKNVLIKASNLFSDKTIQIIGYSLLMIIIVVSIILYIFKERKR